MSFGSINPSFIYDVNTQKKLFGEQSIDLTKSPFNDQYFLKFAFQVNALIGGSDELYTPGGPENLSQETEALRELLRSFLNMDNLTAKEKAVAKHFAKYIEKTKNKQGNDPASVLYREKMLTNCVEKIYYHQSPIRPGIAMAIGAVVGAVVGAVIGAVVGGLASGGFAAIPGFVLGAFKGSQIGMWCMFLGVVMFGGLGMFLANTNSHYKNAKEFYKNAPSGLSLFKKKSVEDYQGYRNKLLSNDIELDNKNLSSQVEAIVASPRRTA